MKNSKKLREEIAALTAKLEAIVAIASEENRELNADEQTEIDSIQGAGDKPGQVHDLQAQLERAIKLETLVSARLGGQLENHLQGNGFSGNSEPVIRVPARARSGQALKAFSGPTAEADAYASGQFIRASIGRNESARQWCRDHGVITNAMGENDDLKGGVLVPPQFESAIINLKESYGVFGQNVRNFPMTSDTASIPRRLSGLTAYAVGEAAEITASDATMNQVNLTARKWGTLTRISSELSEDAIISIADFLAQEIAYAHAVKEDSCGFLGDGTTTYNGIMGLANVLAAGSVATATGHATMSAVTLDDLEAVVAKLPQYPGIMPKWFFNSAVYWQTGARLQLAAGGVTTQMVAGGPVQTLLGYPVVYAQTLSGAPTTGTVYGYFGDLMMAATKGNRRGVTIAADSSRYFEYDQTAIRSTLRYDINIHEIGTASVAGPIIQCKLG
jgi:HK97 family phage major capsid protein